MQESDGTNISDSLGVSGVLFFTFFTSNTRVLSCFFVFSLFILSHTLFIIHPLSSSEGFAADNMVFGSGGALLQKLNRDTFKCAFKCSEITVNGQTREVFKECLLNTWHAVTLAV